LSVGVRNLLDRDYVEVLDTTEGIQPTETGRSAYGKAAWKF
jgi:outer membrane receptor protein involved in Fe transport